MVLSPVTMTYKSDKQKNKKKGLLQTWWIDLYGGETDWIDCWIDHTVSRRDHFWHPNLDFVRFSGGDVDAGVKLWAYCRHSQARLMQKKDSESHLQYHVVQLIHSSGSVCPSLPNGEQLPKMCVFFWYVVCSLRPLTRSIISFPPCRNKCSKCCDLLRF